MKKKALIVVSAAVLALAMSACGAAAQSGSASADSAAASGASASVATETLTVEEAGQILRVGRNTAYELVRCGKLPSVRVGKQIRIPRQALLDYLSRQK